MLVSTNDFGTKLKALRCNVPRLDTLRSDLDPRPLLLMSEDQEAWQVQDVGWRDIELSDESSLEGQLLSGIGSSLCT